MPKAKVAPTLSLTDLLLLVRARAESLAKLERRRACLLAVDRRYGGLSDEEYAKLASAGNGTTSMEIVDKDRRLRAAVEAFTNMATPLILQDERVRMGAPPHRKPLVNTACEFFMGAVREVTGHPMLEHDWLGFFLKYLWWLQVRETDTRPPEQLGVYDRVVEGGQILDTPEFVNDFLEVLWRECPEECAELGLSKPAEEALVTLQDIAHMCGVKKVTARRWYDSGHLPEPDELSGKGEGFAHKWRYDRVRSSLEPLARKPLPPSLATRK